MKFIQFFKTLLKKKYVWIPLLTISVILQLIGIATLIGIHSYQLKPIDGTFGPWQYSYELSEKAALDTWQKNSEFMKTNPIAKSDRTFGEFRVWVELANNKQGDPYAKTVFGDGTYANGLLYINSEKHSAHLDYQTGEISFDHDEFPSRTTNWHWYDWMGLRTPGWLSSLMMEFGA